ncbi:Protein of unknown function [Pyronema omphalodes CBS 100304]|uniref:Uncharacterized protein n=1 Tax=Pyronema omphalodes (strain CBS 100304) TaxID=1076935 RepID=U4L6N2_PYROM|nr:Protein of unknown function [Pyronema omphalodes CBS 100304]
MPRACYHLDCPIGLPCEIVAAQKKLQEQESLDEHDSMNLKYARPDPEEYPDSGSDSPTDLKNLSSKEKKLQQEE